MATCTMAKVRSLGLLPTSLATRALAVTFQSVTTSAYAGAAHRAAATMPGSRTVTRVLRIALMAGLLVYKHEYRKPSSIALADEQERAIIGSALRDSGTGKARVR